MIRDPARSRLRVAMLAPPWIEVPPRGYGGVERVASLLTEELVARGHDVTLFAAPGSRSAADVRSLLPGAHPGEINQAIYEVDHVARAFAAIDEAHATGGGFDVVHDHCGYTALAMADRLSTPIVHTIHGPLIGDELEFYSEHGEKATLVALSRAQIADAPAGICDSAVVPNPIVAGEWPLRREKDDYLLWVGRMSPDKGPHRAIEAARMAGRRLVLAGPIQPGQELFFADEVEPRLGGGVRIDYVGEVGGRAKTELFARASALLMPIRWPEPFGLVMTEALACGTPVIAFPEGSAPEIVRAGENGFLVDDESAMAAAVAELSQIDPAACRASAADRYDIGIVASGYERVYRAAFAGVSPRPLAVGRGRAAALNESASAA